MKQSRNEKKYFIKEHLLTNVVSHGGIGNKDIEHILLNAGFKPLQIPFHQSFSIKAKIFRIFYMLYLLFRIPASCTIVFQHPLYSKINVLLIQLLKYRSTIKRICIVTDLDGLRDGNDTLLKKEIQFFSHFKFFIVHNKAMENKLKIYRPHAHISILHFFDYLAEPNQKQRKMNNSVAFAGNLSKSSFVGQLHQLKEYGMETNFYIYGETKDLSITFNSTICYKGVYAPYVLPNKIEGSFGLVWDGKSINNLEGPTGKYLLINSPHKLSLYILAGLPLIVHHESAAATLVEQFSIGFTIQSLYEIEEKIKALTYEQYNSMQANCHRLSKKIATGGCLKEAIDTIEMTDCGS